MNGRPNVRPFVLFSQDVFSVDSMFEELDFPYDVLWLDIEHTDGACAQRVRACRVCVGA